MRRAILRCGARNFVLAKDTRKREREKEREERDILEFSLSLERSELSMFFLSCFSLLPFRDRSITG